MKNKTGFLIFILSLIIIVILIIVKVLNISEVNSNIYEIKYYRDNDYLYEMEVKKDEIVVTSKNVIKCSVNPCEPMFIERYKVEYKEEYRRFIENLFKDKNGNNITVFGHELSDEDNKELSKIIGLITYDIIGSSYYESKYSRRGYYLEKVENNEYMLTVALGEKSTGGYDISIFNINQKNETEVYVSITEPSSEDYVTQSLTYPVTQVKFSKKPKRLKVLDITSNEEFNKVELD